MADLAHSEFEVGEFLGNWIADLPEVRETTKGAVHPIYLPDYRALPGVTYRRTSTERRRHTQAATGNAKATFRLACLGDVSHAGYKAVCRLARAIRLGTDGFRGSQRGHYVQSIVLEDESDDDEPPTFADGTMGIVYQRVLILAVGYVEEVKMLIQDRGGE